MCAYSSVANKITILQLLLTTLRTQANRDTNTISTKNIAHLTTNQHQELQPYKTTRDARNPNYYLCGRL